MLAFCKHINYHGRGGFNIRRNPSPPGYQPTPAELRSENRSPVGHRSSALKYPTLFAGTPAPSPRKPTQRIPPSVSEGTKTASWWIKAICSETTNMEPAKDNRRYHDLDFVRAAAMLLGLLLHVCIFFMPPQVCWEGVSALCPYPLQRSVAFSLFSNGFRIVLCRSEFFGHAWR